MSHIDIEGAAEAAYESIFTEKPGRPKAPHESWETLPEFYRNQYRRIARAVGHPAHGDVWRALPRAAAG